MDAIFPKITGGIMFKNIGFITSFLFLILLCFSSVYSQGKEEDAKFDTLTAKFFDEYFKANPVWATFIGDHRYDGGLNDYSSFAIQEKKDMLGLFLNQFKAIDTTKLSSAKRIDHTIILDQINYQLFDLEVLKDWEKSPLEYNYLIGGSIHSLITRDFALWEKRLRNVLSRLKQIPRLLEQAKRNLKNPAQIQTETAIKQNKGTISLIRDDLAKVLDNAPGLKDSILEESKKVVSALEDYQNFLEKGLLPNSKGEWRLGEELYKKKLRFALESDMPYEEVIERAEKEYQNVRKQMYQTALPLHKNFFPEHKHTETGENLEGIIIREVLDEIAKDHPKKDEIIDVCRNILKDLERFVKEKNIIDISKINPLQVEWEPEFSRGVAIGGLDSPGPLDKKQKSFYRVSPLPQDWPENQIESFLREYNNWMLVDLSIHEAVPGHYVQGYYSNLYPSLVRSVFGSGPFVEGWAVFAEKIMVDEGYSAFDPRLKLTQLKMYLRAVINAILDAKLQTGKMTEEEAMKLMTEGGFQEEAEAKGKLIRAKLTSAQLATYFVGFQQINDLCEDYRKMKGDKFSLKEFNEKLLGYGSPPVKYLREILMKQ
jgi:uncharacterized protein (DUF885 family)